MLPCLTGDPWSVSGTVGQEFYAGQTAKVSVTVDNTQNSKGLNFVRAELFCKYTGTADDKVV